MAVLIMKPRVVWERLRASFWFVPTLMALFAIGLAAGFIALDRSMVAGGSKPAPWAYGGSAEGAQIMLSTIAGSMITVAGVAFSITIVALVLASNKFGPRLLRNFMRDLGNQLVLGTFISTFVYCLLVLRSVRVATDDTTASVPHAAVTMAVVFALASLGVLIYFIHHVASSINAARAVAAVGADFVHAVVRLFPETIGKGGATAGPESQWTLPTGFASASVAIPAPRAGYLEAVEDDALLDLAREHDMVVVLPHRPGEFVVEGQALMHVWPAPERLEGIRGRLTATITLDAERTLTQDAAFAVMQLVEVALRALSPGINEPFTAITCVDWLAQGLSRVAQREQPSALRLDEAGQVRVIARPTTFSDLVDEAFTELDRYALASITVTGRMMEVFGIIGGFTERADHRDALRRHADRLWRGACETFSDPVELDVVTRARAATLEVLRGGAEAERPPAVH